MAQLNQKLDISSDVVVIKDQQGKYKIWQGDNFYDYLGTPPPTLKTINVNLPPVINSLKPSDKLTGPINKQYSINKIVNKVNEVLSLNLADDDKRKVKNVLFSFCRHVRSLVDALDVLTQAPASGGAGLKIIAAERLMALVKNIAEKIEQEGGLIIDDSGFSNQLATVNNQISQAGQPIPPVIVKTPIQPLPKNWPIKDKEISDSQSERLMVIKPKILPKEIFPKVVRPVFAKDRQITEIKKRPMVYGPVEELAAFTLNDFRKLAGNPRLAADKILDKIELLAEESLTKKSQGIKAWRQSEIYKSYLAMGDESIASGSAIDQLINTKAKSQPDSLTMSEFEAMVDLNKKLRF